MACSGGRIVAVGSSDEVRRLGGADTREVDLKGLTVIPGLTRDDLAEHPVSVSFGAHVTVANSRGLALAGIDRDRPDPAGGSIERNPKTCEPTGILHERAQRIVAAVVPDFDANQRKMGIAFAVGQALERGVTTIHDIVKDPSAVRAYQDLKAECGLHMPTSPWATSSAIPFATPSAPSACKGPSPSRRCWRRA